VDDTRIRAMNMNEAQRRQFVQKAKADRLAFDAAQHLAQGETGKARILADACITLAGGEHLAHWLRHYATKRFQITGNAVDDFLGAMPTGDVAL
jgi:hypothetical protein